jgi:hypothetical protein
VPSAISNLGSADGRKVCCCQPCRSSPQHHDFSLLCVRYAGPGTDGARSALSAAMRRPPVRSPCTRRGLASRAQAKRDTTHLSASQTFESQCIVYRWCRKSHGELSNRTDAQQTGKAQLAKHSACHISSIVTHPFTLRCIGSNTWNSGHVIASCHTFV